MAKIEEKPGTIYGDFKIIRKDQEKTKLGKNMVN